MGLRKRRIPRMGAFVGVTVLLGAGAACSTATTGGSESADAAAPSDDAGGSCLVCGDTGTSRAWTDPTLPLGARMRDMLHDCSGAEACHSLGTGGMTITFGSEFAQMVGVRSTERPELFRVAAGDPATSYLYLKLLGDGGIDGAPMPSGGDRDPRRSVLAWQWIEAGAPVQ